MSETTRKLTLRDLKNKLPVELKDKKDQSFTFRDWTFAEEKLIAKKKDENPSLGKFISYVLNQMLESVHGEDWQSMEPNKRVLYLNQSPIGNPFYMYVYLRFDQIGEELALNFQCPSCGQAIDNYTASLNDIDVDCKQGDYAEVEKYKLKKPITLEKGDILVEELNIGLAKWDVMERADEQKSGDEASMKQHTFRNSIVGASGVSGYFNPDDIINKLKKIDIVGLDKAIANHNAGPNLRAEVVCSKCKSKFFKRIEWSYDDFFGIGSLPEAEV